MFSAQTIHKHLNKHNNQDTLSIFNENKISGITDILNGFENQIIGYGQGLFLLEDGNISKIDENKISYAVKYQDFLLYQIEYGGNINYLNLKNKSKGLLQTQNTYLFKNILFEDKLLISAKPTNLFLKQDLELEPSKIIGRIPKIVYKNCTFKISSFIELIDNLNNNSIWKKEFSDLLNNSNAQTYGPVQIIDNKIFFFLYDSSRNSNDKRTYCLNTDNGKVIWENNDFGGWLSEFNSRLYSITGNVLQILNSNTFELETINLTDCLSKLDVDYDGWRKTYFVRNSNFIVEKKYLYFTEERGNTFGIINLKTKELTSFIKLEINNGEQTYIGKIRIDDKRIYITDSNSTLHVYNKSEVTFANKV